MKKILKPLSYILFLLLVILITLPKTNLYFYAKTLLKEQKVFVLEEKIYDDLFSFTLKDFALNYNFLDLAQIKEASLSTYGFYTSFEIKSIKLDNSFIKFTPNNIDFIKLKHSILNPLNVLISSEGEFGKVDATFSLKDLNLKLRLKESDLMSLKYKNILNLMKKDKGEYFYEYKL